MNIEKGVVEKLVHIVNMILDCNIIKAIKNKQILHEKNNSKG